MMKLMDRYFTKFNISIAAIVATVLMTVMGTKLLGLGKTFAALATDSMDLDGGLPMLMSVLSSVKMVYRLFLIAAVIALVMLIGSIFCYLHKREKELCYVIYTMASAPMIYGALKTVLFVGEVKSALGGSIESMMGMIEEDGINGLGALGLSASILESGALMVDAIPLIGIIKYAVIGIILAGLYAIYTAYRAKNVIIVVSGENEVGQVVGEAFESGKVYAKETSEAFVQKSKRVTESVGSKVKRMGIKQKRAAIAIIAAIAVCCAGFGVWNTFFNFEKIDLMEGLNDPVFAGYDGSGYMESGPEMGNIDYDKTKVGVEDFINSITYSVDKTENLSNGDEVTITAEYSEKTAKALKIKITGDTKKIKVSGLVERYKDGSEIKEADVKILEESMDQEAEEAAEYAYDYRDENYNWERLAILYARDEQTEDGTIDDTVIGIYRAVCGDDTEYFTVSSTLPVNSATDYINMEYRVSSFYSHFVYCIDYYLEDSSAYALSDIGKKEQEPKSVEDWYDNSVAAISMTVYPITVFPSDRPDFWEVKVKKNTITYLYTIDYELDADERKEMKERLQELMEDEKESFEQVTSMLKEQSGIKNLILRTKFVDSKEKVLYEASFQ